jgi:hypothetical protein
VFSDIENGCLKLGRSTIFISDGTQGTIIKCLYFKKMKIAEIHRELMLCFFDDIYTPASIKHWLHEFKISRISIDDESRPRNSSLDHIDATILK